MAKSAFQTSITTSGPFFRNDPKKTFRQNARVMMAAVAAEGEAAVVGQIAAIPPAGVRTGHTREAVVGRVRSLTGRQWAVTAVISVSGNGLDRKKAISLRAAASEIESKAHPFRKTTNRLRRSTAVNRAELLKGIE